MNYEEIKQSAKINDMSFAKTWVRICDDMQREEQKWIEELRAKGVKAAHPNDGWVDRKENTLLFAYPQFNDGAGVGDLVILGSSFEPKKNVTVRLTQKVKRIFTERWVFECVEGEL